MQDERVAWWQNARLGLFIHWGLYSVHGRDVWAMYNEQIPVDEYRRLADRFAPKHFDARQWAAVAKDAGAGYMVMCTRQHDGYSLFDSAVSDLASVRSAAGHDFARAWTDFFGSRAAGHTFIIGYWQSGLHTLAPGASAACRACSNGTLRRRRRGNRPEPVPRLSRPGDRRPPRALAAQATESMLASEGHGAQASPHGSDPSGRRR